MIDIVMDVAGFEFDWDIQDDPEAGRGNFYHKMKYANKLLWSGCETHIVLSAISKLLNLKAEFNIIVNYYDTMVAIIKKMSPKDKKLVGSFYA